MALKLTYHFALPAGNIGLIEQHTEGVLRFFAQQGDSNEFYIGVTNNLARRHIAQAAEHPKMTLMCVLAEDNFPPRDFNYHSLEYDLIRRFNNGFHETGLPSLMNVNAQSGSLRKNALYLLVNKKNTQDIPEHQPGSPTPNTDPTRFLTDFQKKHFNSGVYMRPTR